MEIDLIVGHVPTRTAAMSRCAQMPIFINAAPAINRYSTAIDRKLAGIIFHDEGSGFRRVTLQALPFAWKFPGIYATWRRDSPCLPFTFRFRALVDSTNRQDLPGAYRGAVAGETKAGIINFNRTFKSTR